MELNKKETIIIYKNNDCKIYGECGAILKNSKDYKKINKNTIINKINLNNPPIYSVRINKINKLIIYNSLDFVKNKFNNIFQELYDIIKNNYKSINFKIHVIQNGNGKPMWDLMMLDHPNINLKNINLKNKYGGKYKLYDRYIGKLTKFGNDKIWQEITNRNLKWYKSIYLNNNYYSMIFLNKVKISKTMDKIFINLVNSININENIILLNIPYSFGSEAYSISKSMYNIFGNKLSSFQVIGKAGGIGKKIKLNDYIIANKISLSYPNIYNVNNKKDIINLDISGLDTSLASGENVNVYKSGVKIMPCVLFEDKKYLKKISKEYNAVEMEGYWYSYGLNKNLPQQYLYYISDLPLHSSLAHEKYPYEEGQTLFNGLLRIGLDWIKNLNKTN